MHNRAVSKQRIADHGEVFTSEREVNAMLDMVKQETERIDSRFLEPACGNGNFLAEILRRKLRVVEERYKRSRLDWERNAVLAVSSIYGIDILEDNVQQCRARLLDIFDALYTARFKTEARNECRHVVHFILRQNIVWGNALTLQTVGETPQPILFSEWSFVRGSLLKRRCFAFHELLPQSEDSARSLFDTPATPLRSDNGDKVFIPTPAREYPPTHFLKVPDEQETENEKKEGPKLENSYCEQQSTRRDVGLRLEF